MPPTTRFHGTKRPDLSGVISKRYRNQPSIVSLQLLTKKENTAAQSLVSMSKMKNRINRKIDRIRRQVQADRASVGGGNRSSTFDNDEVEEVEEVERES